MSATPTILLLVPLTSPPLVPESPIKLKELVASTVPAISLATGIAVPFTLPPTIVFFSVSVPLTTLTPPPAPFVSSSWSQLFPVIVTLVSVVVPVSPVFEIPPPSFLA
jgi:hypothetical protein